MTIQQFQYVIAVANSKNFEDAAESCCVTQSTLSTMIKKLEDQMGLKIFNRKTKPVTITKEGEELIERFRIIINEVDQLKNLVQEIKGEMIGELKIGVIPTIAPYLLPLFINEFTERYPKITLHVKELTTAQIRKMLASRSIDIGILALPIADKQLVEDPLYIEPFTVYDCTGEAPKRKITPEDLNFGKMCLLEEGHCLRTQVYDICEMSANILQDDQNLKFESGSMESLIKITESRKGMTILPHLASENLTNSQLGEIVSFKEPVPVRSVGLLTHQYFAKKSLKAPLIEIIQHAVSKKIQSDRRFQIIHPVD